MVLLDSFFEFNCLDIKPCLCWSILHCCCCSCERFTMVVRHRTVGDSRELSFLRRVNIREMQIENRNYDSREKLSLHSRMIRGECLFVQSWAGISRKCFCFFVAVLLDSHYTLLRLRCVVSDEIVNDVFESRSARRFCCSSARNCRNQQIAPQSKKTNSIRPRNSTSSPASLKVLHFFSLHAFCC